MYLLPLVTTIECISKCAYVYGITTIILSQKRVARALEIQNHNLDYLLAFFLTYPEGNEAKNSLTHFADIRRRTKKNEKARNNMSTSKCEITKVGKYFFSEIPTKNKVEKYFVINAFNLGHQF